MATQLGVGGGSFRSRTFLADDQLVLADVDGLVFHQVLEDQGAADWSREKTGVLPVDLGYQLGALGRDGGFGVQALLAQACDSRMDHRSTSNFHGQPVEFDKMGDFQHSFLGGSVSLVERVGFVQSGIFIYAGAVIWQQVQTIDMG